MIGMPQPNAARCTYAPAVLTGPARCGAFVLLLFASCARSEHPSTPLNKPSAPRQGDAGEHGDAAPDAAADSQVNDADTPDTSLPVEPLGFSLVDRFTLAFEPSGMAIGDLTGDGRPDLVAAAGQLLLVTQQADGTLSLPMTHLYRGADNLALIDADEDGAMDVLVTTEGGVLWKRFRASDGPAPAGIPSLGPTIAGVPRVVDVDRDGHQDIVGLVDFMDYDVVAYLGDGKGAFKPKQLLSDPLNERVYRMLATGDVDDDGFDDLVVYRQDNGPGSIEVYLHDRKQGFIADAVRYPVGSPGGFSPQLLIGDLNDDGRNDVLIGTDMQPGIAVFGQTANGKLERRGAVATGGGVGPFAVQDVDHDGHSDVIVLRPNQSRVYVYSRLGGAYRELTSVRITIPGSVQPVMAVGDLDSDGCVDVTTVSPNNVSVFYGQHCLRP